MKSIGTAWFVGRTAELDAAAIRREVERFARLLCATGVGGVRVWCSYNPDLPDDSPLQSPERILPPQEILGFFDEAQRNGVWKYGDVWNRACIEALDGAFTFFLGDDNDLTLERARPGSKKGTRSLSKPESISSRMSSARGPCPV
jgi:hypothetical protein